ncbi:MAG: hypothetical protein R3C09_03685 [Pirellulaceae bacterium]
MSTPVATPTTQAGRLRHSIDWLLGLSLLGSLPLASVFVCDLWFRSDYRFFPLLIIVPLVMPMWRGRYQPQAESGSRQSAKDIPRRPISLGLWFASGLSAICAPLLFSPWLAMLALTLSWCAWILERMRQTPWPRLLKWTLPLLVLLLLPLSERSDPLPSFSSSVTYASSSLLDLIGIANVPAEQKLQLQSGSYDVAAACRGLGNPYLLFTAAVLLCMSTRCSLSLGLLSVGSAPLWSWGGSVLLATVSAWLAEKQDMYLWLGERLWVAQALVLLIELLSLLLLKRGLQWLLAPFRAHSAGIGRLHKFYNRVVLWPEPDPLRKRSSRSRRESTERGAPSGDVVRRAPYALAVVAGLFLIAGGIGIMRLATDRQFEQPYLTELLTHPNASRTAIDQRLSRETLPDELLGMRLIGFDEFATPGTGTGVPHTARWTYADGMRIVELSASAPYRGSAALVRQRLFDGSRIAKPLQTFELQLKATTDSKQDVPDGNSSEAQADDAFRVAELTLTDSLVGRSYLAFTSWRIDGSSREVNPANTDSWWSQMLAAICYQPTSASLSLWSEGETPNSDEDQQHLQQMLIHAAKLVRPAIAGD